MSATLSARRPAAADDARCAERAVLGSHAPGQAADSKMPRLRRLAMGTGVDLPPLPFVRSGLGGCGRAGAHLQLSAPASSGASGAERPRSLYRRAGRTAATPAMCAWSATCSAIRGRRCGSARRSRRCSNRMMTPIRRSRWCSGGWCREQGSNTPSLKGPEVFHRCPPLRDHNGRRIGVARGQRRHYRSIDHPQPAGSMHARPPVAGTGRTSNNAARPVAGRS